VGGGAAGKFLLARVDVNGTLDPHWGSNGKTTLKLGSASSAVTDLARDQDGRIFAAGSAFVSDEKRIGLARFNGNGSVDKEFSDNGWLVQDVGASAQKISLVVRGKEPIVATTTTTGVDQVIRYGRSGQKDATFEASANLKLRFGSGGSGSITDMYLYDEWKLYLSGNDDEGHFALYRLSATDGGVDYQFGDDTEDRGMVTANFSGTGEHADAMAFDTVLGRIFVVGTAPDNRIGVVSFLPDGVLDHTFYGDGYVKFNFSRGPSSAAAVAVRDEKVTIAGTVWDDGAPQAAFVRTKLLHGQEDQACYDDGTCDGTLTCDEFSDSGATWYMCAGPGQWVPPPWTTGSGGSSGGHASNGENCPGEGQACQAQPSECTRGSFEASGVITCNQAHQPVCKPKNGTNFCASCGGDCGQCLGQPCGSDNPCMPGLACVGPPGDIVCRAACIGPASGECWTIGTVGTCDAELGCAASPEVCNGLDDDCDGKEDNTGVEEKCGNNKDDDCNGKVDEGC
jgi:hypothetical protein